MVTLVSVWVVALVLGFHEVYVLDSAGGDA
jgi:hypothetical protein